METMAPEVICNALAGKEIRRTVGNVFRVRAPGAF